MMSSRTDAAPDRAAPPRADRAIGGNSRGGNYRGDRDPAPVASTALDSSIASQAVIRVERISKRFGTTQALDGVSLSVEAGRDSLSNELTAGFGLKALLCAV
jgi:hypothetical protein